MLGKFLLTLAVIVLAFYAVRQRYLADAAPTREKDHARGPFTRHGMIQIAAAAVVAIMLIGSGWALLRGVERGDDVVTLEVVNSISGAADRFQARRRDVGERTIVTLDGRHIRLSEVDRLVILEGVAD
jgi:hypothetical protein